MQSPLASPFIFREPQGFFGSAFSLYIAAKTQICHIHAVCFASAPSNPPPSKGGRALCLPRNSSPVQCSRDFCVSVVSHLPDCSSCWGCRMKTAPPALGCQDECILNCVGLQLLGANAVYLVSDIKSWLRTEAEFNFFCLFSEMITVTLLFAT